MILQVFCVCVGDIQRYRFPLLALISFIFFLFGGDGRVTCGISTIPRVSRSLLSKGPSLSFESLEDMLSCSDSATFCHVLSTCQCFHTHPFHEDLREAMATLHSGFCLDFCLCGCCSGEPFAKADLDAEWDAMARQCPA